MKSSGQEEKYAGPLVSVVMSCFNEPKVQLEEAVESILNQTHGSLELVVILDDPENKTLLEVLKRYEMEDDRVKVFVQNKTKGLAEGRNKGIELSGGKYVAMMDADDIAFPNRLERELKWMENNDCDLVFSHMEYISEEGNSIGFFRPSLSATNPINSLLLRPVFGHPTALVKKEVFESERYDPNFKRAQDIELWIRLLKGGFKFCVIPEILLKYRLHRNGTHKERLSRQKGYLHYGVKIARKHFKNLWPKPAFWFFYLKWNLINLFFSAIPEKILFKLMRIKDFLRDKKY